MQQIQPGFEVEITNALETLREGGVILYPTDTIWGLGCDATNASAIQKIYGIKQRPDTKSLIILLADQRDLLHYVASFDPLVLDFLEAQVRPTTVVYDHGIHLPDNLLNADGSIAIRVTKDPFCKTLIKRLRKPLVSTSANISGEVSAGSFYEINALIAESADYVVDWRRNEDAPALPSQIIKFQNGEPFFLRK